MSTKTFELYIGPNSKTGLLEVEKLSDVTLKHYESAFIEAGISVLHRDGTAKSVRVQVISDLPTLEKYTKELKKVLNIDEITYHQINKFKFK